MKTKNIKLFTVLLMTSAFSSYAAETAANADNGMEKEDSLGKWDVQVGWVHQWSRGLSVKGPALTMGTDGRRPMASSMHLSYSDNNALMPREFDDGYVKPDLWTSDPGVVAERQGMTWNWGAVNSSQYHYDGGNQPTLTFHRNRGEVVGAVRASDGESSDNDIPSDGIEIKARRNLYTWTRGGESNDVPKTVVLDIDLVIGLAWFPKGGSQWHRRGIEQDVYRVSETYVYSDYYGSEAGGSWGPLSIPYAGEYGSVGGFDAGPLIPATPEQATLQKTYLGTRSKRVDIESEIWRLRAEIGTEFVLPLTDRFSLYAAPQFVLEYVDMDVERTEINAYSRGGQRVTSSSSYSEHKSRIYPGILLTAGGDYRLSEYWYAGASIGYEWLFDDPSVHVGPDRIEYDLNGGEIILYIGRRF